MSIQDGSKNICKIVVTPFIVDKSICKGCFQTIQDAINAANRVGGGTIYIHDGTYIENITLFKNITLQAISIVDGYDAVTIKGQVTMSDPGNAVMIGITLGDNGRSPIVSISGSNGISQLTLFNMVVLSAVPDSIVVGANGQLFAFNIVDRSVAGTALKLINNAVASIRLSTLSTTFGTTIDLHTGARLDLLASSITNTSADKQPLMTLADNVVVFSNANVYTSTGPTIFYSSPTGFSLVISNNDMYISGDVPSLDKFIIGVPNVINGEFRFGNIAITANRGIMNTIIRTPLPTFPIPVP